MTLEELKAEAKKQGYKLLPLNKMYIKMAMCTCGCSRRTTSRVYDIDKDALVYKVQCKWCGFTITSPTKKGINKKWNKAIEEKKANEANN